MNMLSGRKKLKIFSEVSQDSSRSPALTNVLKQTTQRLAETFRAEVAVVLLYNEEAQTLEAQQPSRGMDYLSIDALKLDIEAPGLLIDSFRNGKTALLTRQLTRGLEREPILPGYNVFDLLCCPLVARGKKIGLIVLANKLSRKGFRRSDLTLLETLTPHIAIFIDNAMLYRRSEEKVAQLTSLIRVVDAINTVSNLDQLYNLALDVIRGLFAVEKALINIINSHTGLLETVRSFGYSEEYIERYLSRPFEKIESCYVIQHDSTFLSTDVTKDNRCPNISIDEETKSVLCVPIRSGNNIYGILHMASRYHRAFDDEDCTLANAVAEQIGMVVESTQLFEEINRLAITDSLTGLYNIRHLKRVLGEEVKRSIRYNRPLSFIMLDIDYFKIYNDNHGHLRGDEILRILAGLLQQNTRDVDTVIRYGGEEFSVIIPEVSKQEAYSMAERIRKVIQDHVFPYEEDQPEGNLTVSMGVASLPIDAGDVEELVDKADRALYRSKHIGRNTVCLYSPDRDTLSLHAQGTSSEDNLQHTHTPFTKPEDKVASEDSGTKSG
jgi:diguanylate cyclase (GGDEF)-like protein